MSYLLYYKKNRFYLFTDENNYYCYDNRSQKIYKISLYLYQLIIKSNYKKIKKKNKQFYYHYFDKKTCKIPFLRYNKKYRNREFIKAN